MAKSANKSQHWAILGGTFDPVHIGHLRIAIQLRDLGFDKILLIPNRVPPHRPQPQANSEQRLSMLELACTDLEGIEACDIELKREQPSFSSVTVETLRSLHPDVCFTWAMGEDAWHGFEHWHQPHVILDNVNLLIISRPGDKQSSAWQEKQLKQRRCNKEQLFLAQQGKICFLNWPELDVSASSLRKALSQGQNIQLLTPSRVITYIQQQRLYL